MQLGDKKLVVQRASVGAKGGQGMAAPVQVQVSPNIIIWYVTLLSFQTLTMFPQTTCC